MKVRIISKLLLTAVLISFVSPAAQAKENIGIQKLRKAQLRTAAGCAPASSSVELDINNVRCLIHNGGDMWWDLQSNPRYEVPKVSNPALARHSSFAGSLWIGGVDEAGQLRVAAQTYRQSGYDFWPGPLTDDGATIDEATCVSWDKHYSIKKQEINDFRSAFAAAQSSGSPIDMAPYPNVVGWPAFGFDAAGNRVPMAPFVDIDGDPFNYNPEAGDYPKITPCEGGGEPDMAIWWVINDKGNVHTETGGEAIGVEIQMLAFAFSTANAVNDMTFYKYKVINKSTLRLNNTYMGQWVDSDVGNYQDDYVGCDTTRGLGFAYNGDADDDQSQNGYGFFPPAFGLDFFQGPFGDAGVRLPMQRFVYYENDFSLRGNPEVATHFYGYLIGKWKDGSSIVNNGTNGYGTGPEVKFIYPGDPGFCGGAGDGGWSEVSAGNTPFDRRFLQSAGPFTLQPGAINDIIVGAVWARGNANANLGSVCELKESDDIAQALFDNCFKLLDGPDAPEIAIGEYDKELVLTWNYSEASRITRNNYNESYIQDDPVLVSKGVADPTFEFEGYMVFQLKDGTVSASQLFDSEKARLIAQCDVKNGISTIVNRTEATIAGWPDPVVVDQVMVQGEDEGVFHSLRVTEDEFAEGSDRSLKNYTNYYYTVIAYAYNDTASDGRKFVQGNGYYANVSALPHPIDFENFGTTVQSEFGDGIQITQIAGEGNGDRYVKISAVTESALLANPFRVSDITYLPGYAPIEVEVINPKEVKGSDYRVEVVDRNVDFNLSFTRSDTVKYDSLAMTWVIDSTFADWILYEGTTEVYRSIYIQRTGQGATFNRPEPMAGIQRVIDGHGIAITVAERPYQKGDSLYDPVIGSDLIYTDPLYSWMTGVADDDDFETWNWLLCGSEKGDRGNATVFGQTLISRDLYDKDAEFEGLVGGTWGPFSMAKAFSDGSTVISPGVEIGVTAGPVQADSVVSLFELPDVDIVFTADKSKWSQCAVIELSPAQSLGSGARPMSLRWAPSISTQYDYNMPTNAPTEGTAGMSWFPGYAVNVNTGERLNLFFGESSYDRLNNGDDMRWNPTDEYGSGGDRVGGRHFIYVHKSRYDGCQEIRKVLAQADRRITGAGSATTLVYPTANAEGERDLRKVYQDVIWLGTPMLNGSFLFDDPANMPSDVRVELRVNRPYRSRSGTTDHPIFTFSTRDIAAQTGVQDVAEKSLMEMIRVVPNPYYGYSRYESSQLQTIVKLTNLPQKCKIRIFTLNGTLIRTFNKDSDAPEQVWDLKNQDGVPVASGVYIIHIDGFELGETVLKSMLIMPKIDLTSF